MSSSPEPATPESVTPDAANSDATVQESTASPSQQKSAPEASKPEVTTPESSPAAGKIPDNIEEATEQAKAATKAALDSGITRLQVDMSIPELKHQPIAQQFLDLFAGKQFKVLFPDAGAAALARRDWSNPDFVIRGLGELAEPVDADDDLYLVVNPSSVEVAQVESLCNQAIDQPVVLLNPQLEDVSVVGIGYAARQIRERFLSQIETCYYIRALDGAALYRAYPGPWQIWKEITANQYEWLTDLPKRPSGEEIDRILYSEASDSSTQDGSANGPADEASAAKPKGRKKSIFSELQQFLRALSQ